MLLLWGWKGKTAFLGMPGIQVTFIVSKHVCLSVCLSVGSPGFQVTLIVSKRVCLLDRLVFR